MKFNLYQIDAFTDIIFRGNPACVVPLHEWLEDDILLNIAKENAVAETAFFIYNDHKIHLRWFTPQIEMDLCGHATLATAYVLKTILNYKKNSFVFSTLSGDLTVSINEDLFTLDFPARKPFKAELPHIISRAVNTKPKEVLKSRDYVLVYENEQDVKNIEFDQAILNQINLDPGGIIVTAKGKKCDFVSRFFTPQASIPEDPVTGSAHCTLIPYWSEQLNKKEMLALQISDRGGKLLCVNNNDRVLISGNARTYSIGTFEIQ